MPTEIIDNLKIAKKKIDRARKVSGVDSVTIVGVTKMRDESQVTDLIMAGCTDIGENRILEWEEKYPRVKGEFERRGFQGDYTRHLLGHLQTNKVRRAVLDFNVIQSLDSLKLAERVSRIALDEKIEPVRCLVQIKLGEEDTKSGIDPDEFKRDFENMISLEGIRIIGLMLIAPLWGIGEEARPYYMQMHGIFQSYKSQSDSRFEMKYLSMGMSADFDVAVEEGANMVRIGRALFEGFDEI